MSEGNAQPENQSDATEAHRKTATDARKAAFLTAFRVCGNVSRAASAADVDRATHYRWLEDDDEYVRQFALAKEDAADALEGAAHDRAVNGLRRLKFHQGVAVKDPDTGKTYVEHVYSDQLLIAMLEANRPEKFRKNVDLRHSGPDGGPVKVETLARADLTLVMASPELHAAMGKLAEAIEGGGAKP